MEWSQALEEVPDIGCSYEGVVVVWQDTPSGHSDFVLGQDLEKVAGEGVHAVGVQTDVGTMLVAGGGDVKPLAAEVGAMWRGMPRVAALLASVQQFLALFGRELTPAILRAWHGRRVAKNA